MEKQNNWYERYENLTQPDPTQSPTNNSGQGKNAIVPKEIRGWNWGAFFLTWIWGLFHGVWWSLLIIIPDLVVYILIFTNHANLLNFCNPWTPFILDFIMIIIFGLMGNKWAWQSKHYDSVERFKKIEKVWAIAGLIVDSLLIFAFGLIGFITSGMS